MNDPQCIRFLQWALPQMRFRWPGFRKVHKQVCKRIARRMKTLGLEDLTDYRIYIKKHPGEWRTLDTLCRVTISRFFRDRGVFRCLEQKVIPTLVDRALARGDRVFRIWSAGCGSGEEPYTLSIIWHHDPALRSAEIDLQIVATDADPAMLQRALQGCYFFSSLKEIPTSWREAAFLRHKNQFCLKGRYQHCVEFIEQDIRHQLPEGRFELILCRNLVFTYFEETLQREILQRLHACLHEAGGLVLGKHETVSNTMAAGWAPWFKQQAIYRAHQA